MHVAIVRSLFAFVTLFFVTRMMGKKQISQLTFFDYVVGITIGSVASTLSVDLENEPLPVIAALITWAFMSVVLGWLSLRNRTLEKLLNSEPTVIVQDGKILEKNMGTARYNLGDLLMQLRLKNAFNLADVEVALLEPNGELSVLKKSEAQPVTPRTMDIAVAERGMPSVIIEDGKLLTDTLEHLGYDEEWVKTELEKQGVDSVDEVMLAQVDGFGELYIDLKTDSLPSRPFRPETGKKLAADLDTLAAELAMFALETDSPEAKQMYDTLSSQVRRVGKTVSPLILH